jgi:hypothetical protein
MRLLEVVGALRVERREHLGDDGVADEAVRRLADYGLTRLGRLLQTRGDVDGVAGRERLVLRRVAGDDLAGDHADP